MADLSRPSDNDGRAYRIEITGTSPAMTAELGCSPPVSIFVL
jgi:hypothetical protein